MTIALSLLCRNLPGHHQRKEERDSQRGRDTYTRGSLRAMRSQRTWEMKDRLHILRELARHYERTRAGRTGFAEQFSEAALLSVPEEWREEWVRFCARFEEAARHGEAVAPFERDSTEMNHELLALVPKLLAGRGESLLRFASCVLCGNSKRLE